jgi:hypothetical protein
MSMLLIKPISAIYVFLGSTVPASARPIGGQGNLPQQWISMSDLNELSDFS